MAFSRLSGPEGEQGAIYLRSVHGNTARREVFRLDLRDGEEPISFNENATPTLLRLQASPGFVEICIAAPNVVRVRGEGVGLRLSVETPGDFTYALPRGDTRWEVNSFMHGVKYLLTSLEGRLVVDAPWRGVSAEYIHADFRPDPASGKFEAALEEFTREVVVRDYPEPFEAALRAVEADFHGWMEKTADVPEEFSRAQELAAYVNWASVVAPQGHLRRPAMFMSKNWMANVWSWDNCFNAMALVYAQPELAWDQFMILLDNQDASGVFPDSINDRTRVWNFNKPPIQGWVLRWMMQRTSLIDTKRLVEVYEPLGRWTDWWFNYRDDDHDGIPQYNHGNDSGWDNSTIFREGMPVESPDLAAYLVVQMDVLSEVAQKLGKPEEARAWKKRADGLLARQLEHFWRNDRFVAQHVPDHKVIESESLILFLPIVLGDRLPQEVLSKLVAGLKAEGRFLTVNGLATESLGSPLYQADGYWRGPIWAPSTMVIVEGLAAAGEVEFARELARRFCAMAARGGMAENFDASNGAPLRDHAYTWTSSVFLVLAHEYISGGGAAAH